MNKHYDPELGQAIFGNPTSEFECPEFIEEGLEVLAYEIERVERNRTQEEYVSPAGNNSNGEYTTDTFDMRSYWWGDCTCGAEEPQHTKECRKENQDRWNQWRELRMEACSVVEAECEGGQFLSIDPKKDTYFQNSNPEPKWTCTCGAEDGWEEREQCDPDCKQMLPNFKCGELEIRWYKYMGRGMSMNKDIDANEFAEVMEKCLQSVRERDTSGPF